MAISFLRTIILYALVVIGLRVMGKRQIGELQPSELVIAIMLAELASIPMQATGIPLISGIIPILTLITLEVFLSFISLKSKKFREIVSGKPSILVHNGTINKQEMEKLRFNNDDLMEELRLGGSPNVQDIQYAILETNGQLSIMLKKDNQPLTLKDASKMLNKKGAK